MVLSTRRSISQRPGTHAVECAVVYPVTFFLILSIIYGAMGVFRYQEMASLARDATRYGSVHGSQYRKDAQLPVGTAGNLETAAATPVDTTVAPYNASPWTPPTGSSIGMLWYQTHPTSAADTYPTQWADVIYDKSVRGRTILLDPNQLQMWIGYTSVQNNPTMPDNFPGSRLASSIKYQVFPEAFIWWNPSATLVTVSTSAMPITN
jgi:hypothetical protein